LSDSLPTLRTSGLLLHDVARLTRKRFEHVARVRRLGLTRAQASVIIHLASNEGVNQVSLAQLMDLEPITLVRLLDRLQAAGLIERRPDPVDRRARNLYLTAAALPLLPRILAIGEIVRREAMVGFTQEDFDVFIELLAKMKLSLTERIAEQAEESAPVDEGVTVDA
jgi:DNA-binding MarR family transcriptional regulator